jgi:hypothetical protein
VTRRLSGSEQTLELAPEDTILEATPQIRDDERSARIGRRPRHLQSKAGRRDRRNDQNFALRTATWTPARYSPRQSHLTSPTVTVDYDA